MNKRPILSPEQKALEINLDTSIYGTFAEIGAGQEVARVFFQVGAAAGTIAKTMSAYDKIVSDDIYGPEFKGRYVCESRVYKMLDHEYDLLESRLRETHPDARFFAFADSVAAINYSKTIKGDGWIGIRFQLDPESEPNEVVLHVKMLDGDNRLQQQAVGILGVNLLYACYRFHDDIEVFIQSLRDNLWRRVKVDMMRISGPSFAYESNRWVSLLLVKHNLTDVAIFDSNGVPQHTSEIMYKKSVVIARGTFRPATLVNQDFIQAGYKQALKDPDVDPEKTMLLTEITMENLCLNGPIDKQDFMDRAELLCALGYTVVISDSNNYQNLINYFSDYKITRIGLIVGVFTFMDLINEKYYQNQDGSLLTAFGRLFRKNVRFYIFPAYRDNEEDLITSMNLPIPSGIKFLYKYLTENRNIVDIEDYDLSHFYINADDVLALLQSGDPKWESMVPPKVAQLVKEKGLFGYQRDQLKTEY